MMNTNVDSNVDNTNNDINSRAIPIAMFPHRQKVQKKRRRRHAKQNKISKKFIINLYK